MSSKLSSIQLRENTKELLAELHNHKNESYESIILRLIDSGKGSDVKDTISNSTKNRILEYTKRPDKSLDYNINYLLDELDKSVKQITSGALTASRKRGRR